jgi:hypothetical protein
MPNNPRGGQLVFHKYTLGPCLVALGLFLGSAALAQPADVFPLLDGGVVRVVAATGPAAPEVPDTASLAVIQMNGSSGETIVACAPDAPPGVTVAFSAVTVENPGGGEDAIIKARSYALAGCTGDLYANSVNTGFVRFLGPLPPTLMPGDTPTIDLTIP